MTSLRRDPQWRSAQIIRDKRRTCTDEQSNHAVVAMERCIPARRPPFVVLSVGVGAQLEEELGSVNVAVSR